MKFSIPVSRSRLYSMIQWIIKMSEFVRKLDKYEEARQQKRARLQNIYKARGGEGNVHDFSEMGARDPDSGVDTHWDTMLKQDRQLWLDLHETGLTDMHLELEELISEGDSQKLILS